MPFLALFFFSIVDKSFFDGCGYPVEGQNSGIFNLLKNRNLITKICV